MARMFPERVLDPKTPASERRVLMLCRSLMMSGWCFTPSLGKVGGAEGTEMAKQTSFSPTPQREL